MREIKHVGEIIQQHCPLPNQRGNKRWVLAQRKHCRGLHQTDNASVEASYHRVIDFIKTRHLKLGEVYFERDYKHDRTEGLAGMHCFLTPNFYWRLDCAFTYNYEVTYAFHNCAYEADVRQLLQAYPLDRTATEKALAPNFDSFYQTVMAIQEQQFIHFFTR